MAKILFNIKYRPQIESGEYKVILDCGVEAEILAWDKSGEYPIVCMARKDGAIPFRVNNKGKAYHFPEGANYSDLFLITPEPELSAWELAIAKYRPPTDSKETIQRIAAELLTLAERKIVNRVAKECYKEDFCIEDTVKFHEGYRLGKEVALKEFEEKYKQSWFNEGKIAGRFEGLTENEKYQQGVHDGKEEALNDLPRWRKWGNGACGNSDGYPIALVAGYGGIRFVSVLGTTGEKYIMLDDLKKLPGFKENESYE